MTRYLCDGKFIEADSVEEARAIAAELAVKEEEEGQAEPPESEPDGKQADAVVFDPSQHSIAEIRDHVGDDAAEAQAILDMETGDGGRGRKGVIEVLTAVIGNA